jgi:hypothetical protein
MPAGFDFSFNTIHAPTIFSVAMCCLATEGTAAFVAPPFGE